MGMIRIQAFVEVYSQLSENILLRQFNKIQINDGDIALIRVVIMLAGNTL